MYVQAIVRLNLQVNEKGKESLRELPYEIVDFDTGQYEVPRSPCFLE